MINGVAIKILNRIPDDRGKILHIMKNTDVEYKTFGEVYCSTIYPGIVKGWHLHKVMTLNYAVLKGKIKFVLFDPREDSPTYGKIQEIYIGEDNYVRVTVPPGIWNGFMGVGINESFVINFTDISHDPDEIIRLDPHNNDIIDYDWSIKDR